MQFLLTLYIFNFANAYKLSKTFACSKAIDQCEVSKELIIILGNAKFKRYIYIYCPLQGKGCYPPPQAWINIFVALCKNNYTYFFL